MGVLSYDKAVEICADYFEAILNIENIALWTPFYPGDRKQPVLIGPKHPVPTSELLEAPDAWVRTAQGSKAVHEALTATVKALRKEGESLPREVEQWLIALALDEIHPPDEPKRKQRDINQALIYHTVAALIIKAGFHATRNPELGRNSNLTTKRSACDVVADALEQHRKKSGLQLPSSYGRVQKIWQRAKGKNSFDRDEYILRSADLPIEIWDKLGRATSNEEQ